jgi:hypothetical protein
MCNLFGGSSCTWVLILVIVFLLSQDSCDDDEPDYGCGCNGAPRSAIDDCGCGCGR